MNNEEDRIGGLLKELAMKGTISPAAAGLSSDTLMPAMPQEEVPAAMEAQSLPEISPAPEALKPATKPEAEIDPFFSNIAERAESWHGSTPVKTKDAQEANKPKSERSSDIAFGHKIKDSEWESGEIHGIRFLDDQGNPIELTKEQGLYILQKDFEEQVDLARRINWDNYLESIGSSWEELDPRYQKALGSLAFNVGGTRAGEEWKKVLQAAANENVQQFAKEMRRQNNEEFTEGTDNRVAKELYYAGIIDSFDEVADVLPLANARVAGIPETKGAQYVAQY